MSNKILWFDTETTGLDPKKNDPVQIAGIIEIDGNIVEEFQVFSQPIKWENISEAALKVNGLDRDKLKKFASPKEAMNDLTETFGDFISKFDKGDKFYPAGYNVRFDLDFLSSWFRKQGDRYFGSWVNWRYIDPLPFIYLQDYKGDLNLPDYKLGTVAKHFGIELDAHDALSDIRATREICIQLGMLND